jgi:hypothetical protein
VIATGERDGKERRLGCADFACNVLSDTELMAAAHSRSREANEFKSPRKRVEKGADKGSGLRPPLGPSLEPNRLTVKFRRGVCGPMIAGPTIDSRRYRHRSDAS